MEKLKKITALFLPLALLLPLLPGAAWATETEEVTEETSVVETADEETAEEAAAEEAAVEETMTDETTAEGETLAESIYSALFGTATIAETSTGSCGDNLTWELDDDGTLTISGTGAMDDWNCDSDGEAPWYGYRSGITSVVIKEGVTNISSSAFEDCYNLNSVTIASSVTSIDVCAFMDCRNLTSINIPSSVDYIGGYAFYDCVSLTSITIPSGVTVINDSVFCCTGLTSVTIPDSVTYISDSAFCGCENLTSVTIPDGVTGIGEWGFLACTSLTSVTIPASVTRMGMGVFCECYSLTDIYYGGTKSQWEAIDIDNSDEYNEELDAATVHYVPGTPTVSLSNTSTGVEVSWNKVTNASGYYVYRKTTSSSFSKIATISSGSTVTYTDTTAKAGTNYYYTVQAYNSSSLGSQAKTKSITRLQEPTISVSNATSGVSITWTKVTGATSGYYIYRRTVGGSYSLIATVGSSTQAYTDTTAASGTQYYYAVRARSNLASMSSYTSKGILRLANPSGISVSNLKSGVQVKWSSVSGASSYRIYRKTSGGSWERLGDTTSTSYTDKTAKDGSTYTYTIRAISGSTMSYYSTSGKTIKCLSEPTLTVQNKPGGTRLTWTKSTGETGGYYIYRRTVGGSYTKIASVSSGTLTYLDSTAVSGTQYYYAVRAVSNGYLSSYTSKGIVRLSHPTLTLSSASTGVKLTWTKVANCSGYNIYRKSGTGSYTKINVVTGASNLTWTDTTAKSGVTYTYYVCAYKGSSISSYTSKSITR